MVKLSGDKTLQSNTEFIISNKNGDACGIAQWPGFISGNKNMVCCQRVVGDLVVQLLE